MATIDGARVGTDILNDPRWRVAQRVSDSPGFRNCPKLRGFLLYVCENALLGQLDNVREQLIGAKVFGRPADYNLREDNIVRVEARELRKRLATHFETDGRNEPFVIEIPKGGYIPVFRPATPSGRETAAQTAEDEPVLEPDPPIENSRRTGLVATLAALLVVAIAVALWLGIEISQLRHPPHPAGVQAGATAADYSIYRDLLGPMAGSSARETLVVLSNPKVVLYFGEQSAEPETSSGPSAIPVPKSMEGSLSPALNNHDRDLPFHFLRTTPNEYTGMGEAVSAFHLARLMQYLQVPVRVTQGRFLNWDHVHEQNLIVLGGPQINDWTYRNLVVSNFNLRRGWVENRKPVPGEPQGYLRPQAGLTPSGDGLDYAVIKMLNPPYGVRTLLLAGLTSAATAGAGEFFASPEKMKAVHDRIRAAAPGKDFPANWEVVLKVEVRDGYPAETVPIAFRPAPASTRP